MEERKPMRNTVASRISVTRTWETRNAILLAQWLSLAVRVHFRNDYLVLCVGEGIPQLLVDWCKVLLDIRSQNSWTKIE